MRGTLSPFHPATAFMGIIPADAGNTVCTGSLRPWPADHPRGCGEHIAFANDASWVTGSSPRMRGTLLSLALSSSTSRIIPADAGNTTGTDSPGEYDRDHPRGCGEHFLLSIQLRRSWGSSPRMRGTPDMTGLLWSKARIIPADAGNTCPPPT